MTIFKTILLKTIDYDYVTKKIEVESNQVNQIRI